MSGVDSLVLGGAIELLNGGVVSTNPLCAGAMFRLQPGADPGAPQPTTDYVASLILDGERPFGRRAGNRTIKLPIWITGPTRGVVAAAREVLQTVIDQDFWTMTWTRDPATNKGGIALPLLLDCYRAQPTANTFNTLIEKQGYGVQVVVTIPAMPYGRSDVMIQVPFQSPAPVPSAPLAPPPPVVLDNFSQISSTQCFQSNQCVIGPFSACFDPDLFGDFGGQQTPFTYSGTFAAPLSLIGMTSLRMHLGFGSRYWWSLEYRGKTSVHIYVTLTDTSGNTLNFSRSNLRLPVSPVYTAPTFSRVTIPIPQQNTGSFNFGAVASYKLTIVNRQYPSPRLAWTVCYLDNITAYPASQTATPVTRGAVYTLFGVQGTARTPLALQFQQPPTASAPTTLTATGAGTYTVPGGTAYLKVEVIGGGGAGASETASGIGGGGGGAEYAAEFIFPCSPGQVIPYNIGVGGTPGASPVNGQPTVFGPAPGAQLVVSAHGGFSAAQNSATGALGGSGSTNSLHNNGAQGRTATGGLGGGGGSSGAATGPGNSPIGNASQTFNATGNFTIPTGAGPVTISLWGAGGGGAGGFYGAGGGGGEFVQFTLNLAPGTYPFTIGTAGTAGTAGNAGGNGGATTITIGSVTYTANGGTGGASGFFGNVGQGGSGSSSPGEQPGGNGGAGYPYSGGGGSSAGPNSAGNNGNNYGAGGIAPTGGGNGGTGNSSGGAGHAGQVPGGGGGGAQSSAAGGAGAGGQLSVTYSAVGAPTNAGGIAPAGGGNGGAGGPSANTAGSNGAQPGGGGGGANSTGTAEAGGNGGNGQIIITPFQSQPSKTLITHRPPLGTAKSWQPLTSIGGGADAPDGTKQYNIIPALLNIFQTWDFEDGLVDGWTATNAAVANSTAWAYTGTHSLLITSAGGAGAWSATSPAGLSGQVVQPGQMLTATAVVKNPNASTVLNQVQIGINWYNSAGTLLSTATSTAKAVAATAVTLLSLVNAIAPVGAAFASVSVIDNETVAASVTMAIDNIQLAPSVASNYGGTYTVYLINSSWNGTGTRTITVTFTQTEYAGGPSYTLSTTAVTLTPAQVTNGIVTAGVVTLPIKLIPKDNTQALFTVSVTDSNTSDRFNDLIMLDTQGQTVVINEPTQGYVTYYIDTPTPNADLGEHLGASALGRPAAISVMDNSVITGPLYLEPADGDNLLFAYSADGLAPNINASYFSAWWFDRYQ